MKVLSLFAFLGGTAEAFLIMARPLTYERIDPIVSPGIMSGHLHTVVGGSAFSQTFDASAWDNAQCSTTEIQDNHSNYWQPSMMARLADGSFEAVPLSEVRIYYLCNHPSRKCRAFPQGLRMLAGDPSATAPLTKPDASREDGRIGFYCQMGSAGAYKDKEQWAPRMPQFDCLDFLRATVSFPDCWNGTLDSADHKSHMAYRYSGNQSCPESHPIRVPQIDLEFGWKTYTLGYRWNQLMLSTGDQAGYGLHADYLSFWKGDLLQRVLDDPTCTDRQNVANDTSAHCNTLNRVAGSQTCKMETNVPMEEAGLTRPIPTLPGCNQMYDSAKGQKKTSCTVAPPIPLIGNPSGFANFNPQQSPANGIQWLVPYFDGFRGAPSPTPTTTTKSTPKPTTLTTTLKVTPTPTPTPVKTSTNLYMCQSINWEGSCQNLNVSHSSACVSLVGQSYYHNFRSAGPDKGRCIVYRSDSCDPNVEQWLLQHPGVPTFGNQNAHWGSVRCFP